MFDMFLILIFSTDCWRAPSLSFHSFGWLSIWMDWKLSEGKLLIVNLNKPKVFNMVTYILSLHLIWTCNTVQYREFHVVWDNCAVQTLIPLSKNTILTNTLKKNTFSKSTLSTDALLKNTFWNSAVQCRHWSHRLSSRLMKDLTTVRSHHVFTSWWRWWRWWSWWWPHWDPPYKDHQDQSWRPSPPAMCSQSSSKIEIVQTSLHSWHQKWEEEDRGIKNDTAAVLCGSVGNTNMVRDVTSTDSKGVDKH